MQHNWYFCSLFRLQRNSVRNAWAALRPKTRPFEDIRLHSFQIWQSLHPKQEQKLRKRDDEIDPARLSGREPSRPESRSAREQPQHESSHNTKAATICEPSRPESRSAREQPQHESSHNTKAATICEPLRHKSRRDHLRGRGGSRRYSQPGIFSAVTPRRRPCWRASNAGRGPSASPHAPPRHRS